MAVPPLDIHLLLRDIDLSCPANGDRGHRPTLRPLQHLEIPEQLLVHPLKQRQQLFPESPQCLLDSEPLDLRAVALAQLDLERVFGEQFLLDHQRQVADPALNPQGIIVAHHLEIDHHRHRG